MSGEAASDAKLRLRASWREEAGSLGIRYQLRNEHPSFVALVFDGAGGNAMVGDPEWLDAEVCISYEAPDTVHVKRIYVPPPKGFRVTVARVPSVRRLMPGEQHECSFRLRVPLREQSNYFPHHPEAVYSRRPVRQLRLSLGYLRHTEDRRIRLLNPDSRVYRLLGSVCASSQEFVSIADQVNSELEVREDVSFQRC
jgi:hypothetical protein